MDHDAERGPTADPQHITVDVPSAVTTAYGALPAIMALKPEIEATFKSFDGRHIDNLERYASAALYAHTRWLFAAEPSVPLQELIAEAMKRRALLVSALETASVYGLIPADILRDLQGAKGHKNMAVDLIGVTGVFVSTGARWRGRRLCRWPIWSARSSWGSSWSRRWA